ncbi:response regulator transcription factor [Rhodococcus erythropolis]|uniref:response regulator transcription factor n=1 Tax=Rhodococcus erythropolis TaxID=1833 RepID=UPI0008790682|nr:LuxR family transcriptional regulator [Rhodococcus erythropolis]OFV75552.1 HTH-type transcriptional regulator MalT [Rhodococcus erythropolis]
MWAFPRQAALEVLDRDLRLVLIEAPAGYGKNWLVRTWMQSGSARASRAVVVPEPAAAITRARYWQGVIELVASLGRVLSPQREGLSFEDTVTALSHTAVPCVLVLKRPDLVEGFSESVEFVLEQCPRIDVIVTSAGSTSSICPDLLDVPNARLGVEDLLLTAEDTDKLLRAGALDVQPGDVARILEASLGMAALTRAGCAVVGALPRSSERGRRFGELLHAAIDKYVENMMFAQTSFAGLRMFVEKVSVATTFTGDSAQSITGEVRAREYLAVLERNGAIARIRSEPIPTWQFPPAVRGAILLRRRRRGDDIEAEWVSMARRALGENDPVSAVQYGVEAREWPLVIEIVERHWMSMIADHVVTLRAVLMAIPEEHTGGHVAVRAGRNLFTRNGGEVSDMVDVVPHEPDELQSLGHSERAADALSVGCVQSIMLRVSGEYSAAADLVGRLSRVGRYALEARPEKVADFLPLMRLQWGITYQLAGMFAESSVEFTLAYRSTESDSSSFIARNAAGGNALNWALRGETSRAEEWLTLEASYPDPPGWLEPMVKVSGLTARILTALDQGDNEDSKRILEQLGEPREKEELWAFMLYARTRHALAMWDPVPTLTALRRTRASRERKLRNGAVAATLLASAEIDLMIAKGDANQADAVAAKIENPAASLWTLVSVTRLHAVTGRDKSALELSRRVDEAEALQFPRAYLELLLVEAQLNLRRQDPARARRLWRRACSIADQTGNSSSFATVDEHVLRALQETQNFDSTALSTYSQAPHVPVYPDGLALVRLTDREHTVLILLATGLANAQIAEKLFVSANTVKTQIRSLYTKIGGHNREDLVADARALNLI